MDQKASVIVVGAGLAGLAAARASQRDVARPDHPTRRRRTDPVIIPLDDGVAVAVSIVVWAASYYPHNAPEVETTLAPRLAALEAQAAGLPDTSAEREALDAQRTEVEHDIAAAYQRDSYLGRMGRAIEVIRYGGL